MGDFNCVLRNDEKKGGREPQTSVINDFSDWMDDNDLFEAEFLGSKFTWANGKSGVRRILCKLDRAIINEAWLNKFENWRCKALPREVSDHFSLIGFPFSNPRPKRDPFRVQKMWFSHPNFMRMVIESWNAPVSGSPAFIFPYNLKRLKAAMKEWNLRVFGNVYAKLKQAKVTMEVAIRISDEDPEDISKLNSAKATSVTLQEIRAQESILSSNLISELVDENGTVLTDYEHIRDHMVSFFESKFNGAELPIDEELFHYDHNIISSEDSQRMDEIPTMEEIKTDVFDLGADSAPGPDGFSGCFYRHCWDILATRLGSVLDNLVSEEQVAFMKGRNIHENISVASEMVNELKTKCKNGNVGLKVDITQDFDTSLHNLLALFGKYQTTSGQTVCRQKSKVYYGGGSLNLFTTITNLLGTEFSTFPDRYLGVQIMPGAVKYRHISNVIDKIKNQLAVWKGKLLSFQDRIVLINSVIASYNIHNTVVYNWPLKFIKQAERVIHNFLWSGDAEVSRKFVVGFPKV
ncbi:uncharacterized protein LOC113343998 [Papaver somniferum]|uniref:uncharacterized protein LOC113343998 n=1 Tax=Papaver somniferum TaxID=3469 RepID=UPI000E6F6C0B|nr:uncharacterized protein LOC113343998 [Papaver somniferum]